MKRVANTKITSFFSLIPPKIPKEDSETTTADRKISEDEKKSTKNENEIFKSNENPCSSQALNIEETESTESSTSESTNSTYGDQSVWTVWSESQWSERKQKHEWLIIKNGFLGCCFCSEVQTLGSYKIQGVSLSQEWINCSVTFNGSDRHQRLRSLRTKISAHQLSKAHQTASKILDEAKKTTLEKINIKQKQAYIDKTEKLFNTAYYTVKSNRPFTDYENLIELQMKNGIDMGITLHSRTSCLDIITHIASEFRKKLTSNLITENRKFSVLIDESTTLAKESVLIIYIQTCLKDKEELIFLDLVSLKNQSALTILDSLLDCFLSYGLNEEFLQKNLICFTSDGASTMLVKKSGVSKLLRDRLKNPNIIIWHCLNHRLELAVDDSISEINAVNHFRSFMDTLYGLFSQSPKNSNELKSIAPDLGVQLTKIGKILDIRWVSSSFRTVKSVWNSYPALLKYFKEVANDGSRKSTDRSKYRGLFQRMESVEFVRDLALMYDILEELSSLSLQLQERLCTIVRADKLIRRTIRVIGSMRDKPGPKEQECARAAEVMNFNGIQLTNTNRKIVSINREQFIASIRNNLESRCLASTASKRSTNNTDFENEQSQYNKMLEEFGVLNPETWPEDVNSEAVVTYGEEQIRNMCSRFHIHDERSVINAFRDFFESGGRTVPSGLSPLMDILKVIPCSNCQCERGFSDMNLIITPLRTNLLVKHVSSLLFIKLNGPSLQHWNAIPYVNTWLLRHRSAEDTQSRHVNHECSKSEEKKELWELF